LLDYNTYRTKFTARELPETILKSDFPCFISQRDEELFTAFYAWLVVNNRLGSYSYLPENIDSDGPGSYIRKHFIRFVNEYLEFRQLYKDLVVPREILVSDGLSCFFEGSTIFRDIVFPITGYTPTGDDQDLANELGAEWESEEDDYDSSDDDDDEYDDEEW
jgi:hypothetical protein